MNNDKNELESDVKLGKQVHRLRRSRGLSLRALAKMAQLDPTWISKLERNMITTPSPRLLYRLAVALDVEVAEFYFAADYSDGLPELAPYLRSKYDLPDEAIAQLQAHFRLICDHYHPNERGTPHGPHHGST